MRNRLFGLAAAVGAATLATPTLATTFPSLTTIYVGSGVRDNGGTVHAGTATTFHCSNVSGVSTSVRFLVLYHTGSVAVSFTRTVAHGATVAVSTHATLPYEEDTDLGTLAVSEGVINIESLQSGVFCNAKTIDASAAFPDGVVLPLVRVNPHPGTVE